MTYRPISMAHNFKTEPFSGTLWDLIQKCRHWLPTTEKLLAGQNWVHEAWEDQENIFPVRRFAPYQDRGTEIAVDGRKFVSVDNEPLTGFYKTIAGGAPLIPLKSFFGSRAMPASWALEADNINGWKKGGVPTPWREYGIKLAHLVDAAKGISGISPETMRKRFILGFSPLNLFPLPDVTKVSFKCEHREENGTRFPIAADLAEDKVVQEVLRGFLYQSLKDDAIWNKFSSLAGLRPTDHVDTNWETTAEAIKIETSPKLRAKAA